MMMAPIGLGRELVQLDQPAPTFKRLKVPLGGSPLVERALPFAQALALMAGVCGALYAGFKRSGWL